MNTRTPADWKALFESDAFAQQNTYTGPLGVEYTPAGTRLRLWAPPARQGYVTLYRRGAGGGPPRRNAAFVLGVPASQQILRHQHRRR